MALTRDDSCALVSLAFFVFVAFAANFTPMFVEASTIPSVVYLLWKLL